METLLIERPLFPEKGIILLCKMIHHRTGNDYVVINNVFPSQRHHLYCVIISI